VGLDNSAVMLLSAAKSLGVDFTRTAMIGRQSFWPDSDILQQVFAAHAIAEDARAFVRVHDYSERFFELFGAQAIESFDVSSYEQATRLHDMNLPIPAEWRERHSLVFDGGSIEHVFNIPQAFRNCLEMVEVGGHFVQVGVCNNFVGHGFWQFSPELLFRMLTPANGYEVVAVMLAEVPRGRWYRVMDPAEFGTRVELCNRRPTYILTIAKRIARTTLFATPPLQSDYQPLWTGDIVKLGGRGGWSVKRMVPSSLKRWLKPLCNDWSILGQGWSRACYRSLSREAVIHGRL
jgi:hypothetical protein